MNCQFCCQNQANRYSWGKFKGEDAHFAIRALQSDSHIEFVFIDNKTQFCRIQKNKSCSGMTWQLGE